MNQISGKVIAPWEVAALWWIRRREVMNEHSGLGLESALEHQCYSVLPNL
jgi:hypothetical protein